MLLTVLPLVALLVVYGSLGLIAWRRPLLGRLAWREAVRRPAHTILLVAGMMFGTAAILGMQGVRDSFSRVTTDIITTGWGRTDITVSRQGAPFSASVASALAADPRLVSGAIVTATVGIVAGIGVGFIIAWAYVTASGTTQTSIDLSQVLVPAALIYAAVLLVTIGPALQASRMRASEALRIVG
jgi:hypothetical protein